MSKLVCPECTCTEPDTGTERTCLDCGAEMEIVKEVREVKNVKKSKKLWK